MKNRPIFTGFILIILISIIWWITHHSEDTENTQTAPTAMENPNLENQDEQLSPLNSTEPQDSPTFTDTRPLQKEFSSKVAELVEVTQACQKEVETLFPVDSLDGPSKVYKSLPKLKDAIEKFYQVVNQRVEKSYELMSFLEKLPEGEISSERLFSQLSNIEDCGEFEEEAILDQAISTALEFKWPLEQKRELTNLILGLFENQMQSNLGLHQLSSKIEVIHSLLDDGFISNKFNQDLTNLDQAMETAEAEFRQALPSDFSQKRLPTQKDILEIKNAEREAVERIKPLLLDTISLIKNRS